MQRTLFIIAFLCLIRYSFSEDPLPATSDDPIKVPGISSPSDWDNGTGNDQPDNTPTDELPQNTDNGDELDPVKVPGITPPSEWGDETGNDQPGDTPPDELPQNTDNGDELDPVKVPGITPPSEWGDGETEIEGGEEEVVWGENGEAVWASLDDWA